MLPLSGTWKTTGGKQEPKHHLFPRAENHSGSLGRCLSEPSLQDAPCCAVGKIRNLLLSQRHLEAGPREPVCPHSGIKGFQSRLSPTECLGRGQKCWGVGAKEARSPAWEQLVGDSSFRQASRWGLKMCAEVFEYIDVEQTWSSPVPISIPGPSLAVWAMSGHHGCSHPVCNLLPPVPSTLTWALPLGNQPQGEMFTLHYIHAKHVYKVLIEYPWSHPPSGTTAHYQYSRPSTPWASLLGHPMHQENHCPDLGFILSLFFFTILSYICVPKQFTV